MSTCEAEVNAAVVAAKDAAHLWQMLMDLRYADAQPKVTPTQKIMRSKGVT